MEAVIHTVSHFVASHVSSSDHTLAALDFSNPFNEISHPFFLELVCAYLPLLVPWAYFAYGQPARLFYCQQVLFVHSGVQQGDPLVPKHSLLVWVWKQCWLDIIAWYLEMVPSLARPLKSPRPFGFWSLFPLWSALCLNVSKTQLLWPTLNALWADPVHFPPA